MELDMGNMSGLVETNAEPLMSLSEKWSTIGFTNLYDSLDVFSREILFTVANDYALGAGMSIIVVSLLMKAVFTYPTLIAQINGLKMKTLKKDMDTFKEKMKIGQMTRNQALVRQARLEFNKVKKAKGIDNFYAGLNIFQIPFLITWFLSLRYITNLPEIYPQMQTEGFLWFNDLTAYDPYFVLPVFAAMTMSYSIVYSPSMTSMYATNPVFAPIVKYMKFMPFLSLPITAMFPAGINLYWCTLSLSQALVTILMNQSYIQKKFGLTKEMIKPKIKQAVILEEAPMKSFEVKS